MNTTYTIQMAVTTLDEPTKKVIQVFVRKMAKMMRTKAHLLPTNISKPVIAAWSDDFFVGGHEEIDLDAVDEAETMEITDLVTELDKPDDTDAELIAAIKAAQG